MNYEERYNQTIESIKRIYNQADSYGKELMEKEFPELAESDDERIRKELIKGFQHYDKESKWGKFTTTEILSWLEKQGKQIHAEWSEEDKEMIRRIRCYLNEYGNWLSDKNEEKSQSVYKACDWLKSIKDSVQPQPKQEWSEEDEKMMKRIDSLLYSQCAIYGSEYEELHKWLKSIKPQNHWKPSEEQMQALFEAKLASINNREYFLGLLYEDLTKL